MYFKYKKRIPNMQYDCVQWKKWEDFNAKL